MYFLKVKVAQSCLTLCDPMDYRVHWILHTRILEWVVVLFSRGSSQPKKPTQVSHIEGGFFTNKASGGKLFQILKDDAVKVLLQVCQQIWETQQWPQDWKRSVFISIPNKGNAKECSNDCMIALISHMSKVMLKILQARLQQYLKLRTSKCTSWI